ncbi:DUF6799 domain-containing protein [Adhaeribacter rhizoryzae]|uniref:DUF6799 domain-containing protein n=1 Tax=Adhaeribacter rhizoryzae TaxID=2607907 RepID=A0A5M6D958_9BACT|nr:DUF6799 domain-containing protein [Adhaeribacter rhizoryzae]KAA5544041.1 hypothetical protein F0145_15805 [Adhaeribacter rhizoryzae]
MKKSLLLLLAVLFISGAELALAQTETSTQAASQNLQPSRLKDGYAMHQGKMVQIKNGQITPLTQDATLPNGTKVLRDGTVIMPRKKRQKIQEGYVLNTEGQIVMLEYDMFRYDVIQDHAQKTVGNTATELLVTDKGLAVSPNSTEAEMFNRKVAIINERNALVKEKAVLLNKAKNVKEQQNSPAIKKVDEQLQKLEQELKQIEETLQKK